MFKWIVKESRKELGCFGGCTLRGSEVAVAPEINLTPNPAERAQRRLRLLPISQGAPADRGR